MKNKLRMMGIFFFCFCICIPSEFLFASTENDLREVMGIGRTDTNEDAQLQAKAIIASCITDKNYNELADKISEYKLDDFSEEIEIVRNGTDAYEDMIIRFQSGEAYSSVLF